MMRLAVVRWTLLGLYVLTIVSLTLCGLLTARDASDQWMVVLSVAILVGTQAVLLLGAGTSDLLQPIGDRRLLIPVSVGAFMLAALLVTGVWELEECMQGPRIADLWSLFGLIWAFSGVILFLCTRRIDRYQVLRRIVVTVLAASLVELLVAIPLEASRRPMYGLSVGTDPPVPAVALGLYTMLWAMGPAVIMLFLREKRRQEQERAGRLVSPESQPD